MIISTKSFCIVAAACCLVISCNGPLEAQTTIVSRFDTDLEGWTLPQPADALFGWEAIEGNPSGHTRFTDTNWQTATHVQPAQASPKLHHQDAGTI